MSQPVKILHIVDLESENYFLNNLIDFSDAGRFRFIFVNFGPLSAFTRQMEERGCEIYTLNRKGLLQSSLAIRRLGRLMKKIDPDIVHTHLFIPSYLGLTVAKWQNRKTILTRHHSDALYVVRSRVKRNIWLWLEKTINRKSDHIIAPSRMVYDILAEREKVSIKKLSLIPYGQRTERFSIITAETIRSKRIELGMEDRLSFVYVARLFDRKGHSFLFDALSTLVKERKDIMLYLVGSGPHREMLEKMVADKKIEANVSFLGWRDDALSIMAAADIVVHPSLEDALSSAVIEAVMLEKPVVATDISGVRDTLGDGKYGIIVPPSDADAIEKGIRQTIDNLEEAKKKAKEGRVYLLEYMGAQRVADEYCSLYNKMVSADIVYA